VQTYNWLAYAGRFGSTFSWQQVCYEAGQAGYVGVELTGGWFNDLPAPEEAMRVCERMGVRIVAFTASVQSDEELELSRRKLEYLRAVGGSAAVVAPPPSQGVPEEARRQVLADFIERCKRLADYCEQYGVPAGAHNHLWTVLEREEEIRAFLDAAPIGWCPDFGHAAAAHADVVGLLREYGSLVVHGHLKDVLLDEKGNYLRFCELGRGNAGLDFPLLLHVLTEQGFARWLTVEQDQTTLTPMYDAAINRKYLAALGYEAALRG
jgi:sugar phosphate isomerase/epimerase